MKSSKNVQFTILSTGLGEPVSASINSDIGTRVMNRNRLADEFSELALEPINNTVISELLFSVPDYVDIRGSLEMEDGKIKSGLLGIMASDVVDVPVLLSTMSAENAQMHFDPFMNEIADEGISRLEFLFESDGTSSKVSKVYKVVNNHLVPENDKKYSATGLRIVDSLGALGSGWSSSSMGGSARLVATFNEEGIIKSIVTLALKRELSTHSQSVVELPSHAIEEINAKLWGSENRLEMT